MSDDAVITFRRLTRTDFDLLRDWLEQPYVARWWVHETSPEALERDFGGTVDGSEPAEDHLAMIGDEPIGIVQYCHFVDYPEYVDEMQPVYPVGVGAVTIDYFVGDIGRVGKGVGTQMIRAFVDRIWSTDEWATHVVVPVNSENVASWRALLAAGFALVARGDLEPDNPIDPPLHEILRIDRPRA